MKETDLERGIGEAIIAAIPEPFFVFDEHGRYVRIIGGIDRQRYHDGSHLVGRLMHEVMDELLADRFLAEIRKAIDLDMVHTFIYQLSATEIKGSESLPGPAGKQWFEAHISPLAPVPGQPRMVVWIAFNTTRLHHALQAKERLISDLQEAISEIKTLRGILPICAHCKKIRDDHGYWRQLETYLKEHSEADLSHGICPQCLARHYPEFNETTR